MDGTRKTIDEIREAAGTVRREAGKASLPPAVRRELETALDRLEDMVAALTGKHGTREFEEPDIEDEIHDVSFTEMPYLRSGEDGIPEDSLIEEEIGNA